MDDSAPLPQSQGEASSGAGSKTAQSGTNSAKLRKRTKTGCLTCRKRRIKCGEERPICSNCIKSKRTCDGYNQKVTFKPVLGDWTSFNDDGQNLNYHNSFMGPPSMDQYRHAPPPLNTAGFVPVPVRMPAAHGYNFGSPPDTSVSYTQNMHGLPLNSPSFQHTWSSTSSQFPSSIYSHGSISAISPHSLNPNVAQPGPSTPISSSSATGLYAGSEQFRQQVRQPSQLATPGLPSTPQQDVHSGGQRMTQHTAAETETPQHDRYWTTDTDHQRVASAPLPSWNLHTTSTTASDVPPTSIITTSAPYAAQHLGPSFSGVAGEFLEAAAIEQFSNDDIYFDIESDEEMEDLSYQTAQDLAVVRQLGRQLLNSINPRSYETFLYEGILDRYDPSEHANPLNNEATARVFAHFISATGPSLSIYERHPRNTTAIFSDNSSTHQQGIWTYTLPQAAIRNKGLLHAMLALASLHISKLQGTSSTPSFKHFGYAIKDIHKRVKDPKKSLLPTTIAATLLLGFYEVLTADHMSWSKHLAGAKQLLRNVPFKRMAREARRFKAQQLAQKDHLAFYDDGLNFAANDFSAAIDENLVSNLMGRQIKIEQFGQVIGDDENDLSAQHRKPFDMKKYELYQDLYWWYARQDVYQAILSGNNLLLDYHKWADCPPRAGMGRSDAIYGTHDHLILLFARLAEFNAKDRRRKLRVMATTGGQWRPAAGMSMAPPPGMSQMPGGQPPPQQALYYGQPHGSNPNAVVTHPSSMSQQTYNGNWPPHISSTNFNPSPGVTLPTTPGAVPPSFASSSAGYPPFSHMGPAGSVAPGHIASSPNFKREPGFMDASQNAPNSGNVPAASPIKHPSGVQGGPMGGPPIASPQTMFYGMAPLPTIVNMPSSYAQHHSNVTPSPKSDKGDVDLDIATENALKDWQQIQTALNTFESHLSPHFQPLPEDLHPAQNTPFGPAIFYRSHDIGVIWAMYYMARIILERSHPHMPPAAMMAAGIAARQTQIYAIRIGQVVGGIVPPVMGNLNPNLGACLCESSLPLFFAGVQYQDPQQRAWLVTVLKNVEARTGWKSVGMVAQGCESAWEKAWEMRRGPPYKRELNQWHIETAYDSRVARITGNYTALDNDHPDIAKKMPKDQQGTRVHWAMGVLGVVENDDESESTHVSGYQPSKRPI